MDPTLDDLEQSVKRTDEHLDMMLLRVDAVGKDVDAEEDPEIIVTKLMQSVTEVKSDYQNLRRELTEVQAMQQEISTRLRQQLLIVQSKCMSLKEKLASSQPDLIKETNIKSF